MLQWPLSIREGCLTAGQGAEGSSYLCPASGLTQPATAPAQVVEHPFISAETSFPVPYLFVVYPECCFPVSSPSINCHAEFFKPEFSRALLLVFRGVSFRLTPSCSLILSTDHSGVLAGRDCGQSPAQAGSAVGSERVAQGLVQSGLRHLQGWRWHHFCGQPLPWLSCFHGENRVGLAFFCLHPEPPPSACAVFQWQIMAVSVVTSWTCWKVARRLLQSLLSARLNEPCSQTSCQDLTSLTQNFWEWDLGGRFRAKVLFLRSLYS